MPPVSIATMISNPLSKDAGSSRSKVALDFASAALRSGNRLKAQMLLRDRLAEDPSDADALTVLAQISVEDRRIEDATVLLRRAVSADPTPERRLALIEHLQKHAGPALALSEFEELPSEFRTRFEVSGMEAKTLGLLGMHDAQIDTYKRMLRQQPNRAGTWMNLANALRTVGRTDEAVKALKRATKLQPTMGQAYWALANFKSYRFTRPDIAQMVQALRKDVSLEEALHIHFALGKAYEDQAEYEPSFRHYSAGNALRTRQLDPSSIPITEPVQDALEHCRPETFERLSGAGCDARDPIFVFGLHRSGSTLIEQLLASHPQIELAGVPVSTAGLQVGDLVVSPGGVDVGIYLGDGDVVGASAGSFQVGVHPMVAGSSAVRVPLGAAAEANAPLAGPAATAACGAALPVPGTGRISSM